MCQIMRVVLLYLVWMCQVLGNLFFTLISKIRQLPDQVINLVWPYRTLQPVEIEDLRPGDHITVNITARGTKGVPSLLDHHFIIGGFDKDIKETNEPIEYLTRIFDVYDLRKRGETRVWKYQIIAVGIRPTVQNKTKWSIFQDNSPDSIFEGYLKRYGGLIRITHPNYLTNYDEVIRRWEAACGASIKKYNLINNNCEQFATGCKGLMAGYGWSYQSRCTGTVCYEVEDAPQPESGDGDGDGDGAWYDSQQPADDRDDDDMGVTSKDKLN